MYSVPSVSTRGNVSTNVTISNLTLNCPSLYGRVPFKPGVYPNAIIVRSTTTTTTSTTTTTTTASTSTRRPVHPVPPTPPHLQWTTYNEDSDGTSTNEVVLVPLEEREEENIAAIEWGEREGGNAALKDGSIRLTNGKDETEGNVEVIMQ